MADLSKPITAPAVLATLLALSGCGSDDGGQTGAFCGGIRQIASDFDASQAAGTIAAAIEDALAPLGNGNFNAETRSGATGTIAVTGSLSSFSNRSCGIDCISSGNNDSVVAVLSNYSADSGGARITGTVNYSDTTGSQQSGLSFFTFGSVSVSDNGSAITYDATDDDPLCNPRVNGLRDTISALSSSGPSSSFSAQSGSLTASGGIILF